MTRYPLVVVAFIAVVGLLTFASVRFGLGRLPGDIIVDRDGFVLYLGTIFAPTQDRGEPGVGFTHALGDRVTVAAPGLGALVNTVGLATEAPEWTFGAGALMRNLVGRGLL